MPYVYRYIDLEKQEVVYIGKVTKDRDANTDPLRKRHEQHMREKWYCDNADNLVMQFIELKSHADADICETWLISFYSTGQLINVSKTGWGKSDLDLFSFIFGRWKTYQRGGGQNQEALYDAADMLYRMTDGLQYDVDSSLGRFAGMVHDIVRERDKARRLTRSEAQSDFLRPIQRTYPKPEEARP